LYLLKALKFFGHALIRLHVNAAAVAVHKCRKLYLLSEIRLKALCLCVPSIQARRSRTDPARMQARKYGYIFQALTPFSSWE
jgi:hypothetical protein